MFVTAEYIWLDGNQPTPGLRSKTRVLPAGDRDPVELGSFPRWNFDGSSTGQSDGSDSDLTLEPVRFFCNPLKGEGHYLVLCEVIDGDDLPHPSNTRSALRNVLDNGAASSEPWVGFEQEYTLFKEGSPLGWPQNGYPEPQGPFYCGNGSDRAFGRQLVEAHEAACLEAGLMLYGTNAEVMPGQWEFQVGYRGVGNESADPLTVADHLWTARWLLLRLGERFGINVSFAPKPVEGDWNGAGAHTNLSTRAMRNRDDGLTHIREAIRRLAERHETHIAGYGPELERRLTGQHETCAIDEFRGGIADRCASIRIPRHVVALGHGYLEDRRPGANCDPYVVCTLLLQTICSDAAAGRPARTAA